MPSPRPSPRILAGVVALLMAGAALAIWSRIGRGPGGAPSATVLARRSVAILGFKNVSGRPDADWISTATAEALASGLAVGGELRVVSGDVVGRMKADLGLSDTATLSREMLARVGQNLGTDLVIAGSYQSAAGAPLRFDVRLMEAATGQTVTAFAEEGSEDGLVGLLTRTDARLRAALAVGAPPAGETGGLRAALPSKPEAARLYAEGLERLRVFDALGARERLEKASAAEPDYPLVHLAMADAWSSLGYDARARQETRRAFELSSGLPLAERLAIEARHCGVMGDWDKAAGIYRTLWGFFPDDLEYGLHLAAAQTRSARRGDALATLTMLRKLPRPLSEDPRIDLEEARAANALGNYRLAQSAAAKAAHKGDALGARLVVAEARLLEGFALRAGGEPKAAIVASEAGRRLYAAAGDRGGVTRALLDVASVLRYEGDLEQAMRMAEEALAVSKEIGDQTGVGWALGRIASVLAEQGHLSEARRMYDDTLVPWRETGNRSGEGTALNNVGETLWKLGDLPAARKTLENAVALFRDIGSKRGLSFSLFNLGFVLQDQGDLAGARSAQEESLALARAIGERSLTAVALHGLGGVLLAQGDLAGARKAYDESLKLRRDLGERGRAAETVLALAAMALRQGHTGEARAGARDAAKEFDSEKARPSEAIAQTLIADSLLAEGRIEDARQAVALAKALADKTEYRTVRLQVAMSDARLAAADTRAADAVKALKACLVESKLAGMLGLELEARLALAEIELRFGEPRAGLAALEEIEADARQRGFGLLARQAAAERPPAS